MKKKILGLLSALVALTVPLTACGPSQSSGDKWWKTEGELEKNGGEIVFNDVGLRLTSIVVGEDKTALQQIVGQFNAEYKGKIRVNMQEAGAGNLEDSLATSISQGSKSAPDIVMAHQNSLKSFVEYKLVQPLDVAVEETGMDIDLTAFSTGINQYSNAGTEYNFGAPVDAASMVVFYNKSLLSQYTDKVPETREELFEVCEQYKAATNGTPISWETGGDFFAEYIMPTAVMQNGGTLYNEDLRVDWYDNTAQREVYKKALSSVREFITRGYAAAGSIEQGGIKAFREDRALFYVGMPWYLEMVTEGYAATHGCTVEQAMTEKIGATSIAKWFALDASKDYASKMYCDSHTFSITSKVTDITQKAAALEFIKWFTTRGDVGAQWAEAGHVSISNVINNSSDYKNNTAVNHYINKWYPDINYLNTMGTTKYYSDLAKSLRSILSEGLLKTDASGDEGLIKAKQDEFNSILTWAEM